MKYLMSILLLIFICLTSSNIFAEQLSCPTEMKVQENVIETPAGWAVISEDTPHYLKRVCFFDGNPAELANLIPDKDVKKNGRLYSTWYFDAKTAKNLWIRCSYGRTTMTFIRPVNKVYSQCTAISDLVTRVDGEPTLISFKCK